MRAELRFKPQPRYRRAASGAAKRVLIFAAAIGCTAALLAALYFDAAFSSYMPLSVISPSRITSSPDSETCLAESETSKAMQPPGFNGSQEIADLTSPGDTLLSLLYENLQDDFVAEKVATSLQSIIQAHLKKPFDPNVPFKPGKRYSIVLDKDGLFIKATFELEPSEIFHCAVVDGLLKSWKEEVVLDFKEETISFPVIGDLTESVLNAGEGVELALKLSSVFRWDIDFRSESMRGDVCKVLFERRYADDRPSGYGRILSAIYEGRKTGKKTAVLFNNEYYDENGVQLKKNFLRSPLSVLKVTSRYGMRFHPVFRVWRKHDGVDYAAPQGTPVWAIANGVVTFAGWNNGYGNYVCVKHDNGYESRYGHLRKMFVKVGQRVKQRQKVGLVGMTGIATGPHLDFQLLFNGKHINPLGVKMVAEVRSVPEP
ncbi:MAG: M23 family metallopeptidase, partial [Desulfomonilaceae bacterium]